jgi:hypothetical protein
VKETVADAGTDRVPIDLDTVMSGVALVVAVAPLAESDCCAVALRPEGDADGLRVPVGENESVEDRRWVRREAEFDATND